MGGERNACAVIARKLKGNRQLKRFRHRRENNIKMDLRKILYSSMDRFYLEGLCEHGNEPSGSITFWEILK
jgi:hypothetical protein